MTLQKGKPAVMLLLAIAMSCVVVAAEPLDVQKDLNEFYSRANDFFSHIVNSSELKSTRLKSAERLFLRTLKKNRAYYTLLRTNSNGEIISEVVRGKKVERPLRNVSSQNWFQKVKNFGEDYYSLIKDNDRGRYYLFWCKPVTKGNRFVGSVAVKIDLWDSFYEFSNSVYYPFKVELNNFTLFSHKWLDDFTFEKKELTIPGIDNVSVSYIPEKKNVKAPPMVKDTLVTEIAAPVSKNESKNKKPSFPLIILFAISLGLAGTGSIFLVIRKKNRERSLFDMIDNE